MEKTVRAIELYEGIKKGTYPREKMFIEEHCRPYDKAVEIEWQKSHDLSIYHSFEYFYNAIFSYYYISKNHVERVMSYFNDNNIDISCFKALDYYNGIGLTTLDLAKKFSHVTIYNDCQAQVDMLLKLAKEYDVSNISKNKFDDIDVLFSLQEIEHYFEPVEHIKELLEMSKNTKYLVLSHGFTNDKYCGHYSYYKIEDKLVPYTQTFGYVEEEILKTRVKVFSADRGKIAIYRLIEEDIL